MEQSRKHNGKVYSLFCACVNSLSLHAHCFYQDSCRSLYFRSCLYCIWCVPIISWSHHFRISPWALICKSQSTCPCTHELMFHSLFNKNSRWKGNGGRWSLFPFCNLPPEDTFPSHFWSSYVIPLCINTHIHHHKFWNSLSCQYFKWAVLVKFVRGPLIQTTRRLWFQKPKKRCF